MSEVLLEVERARSSAASALSAHEILCERRYAEIQSEMCALKTHSTRTLRLLYVLVALVLGLAVEIVLKEI